MDPLDVPTPLEVEGDLKQIVHELKRWEGLPLRALRALPSVRYWTPSPEERGDYDGKPAYVVSNMAVRKCIEKAITRTVLEEDWQALAALFTFDDPTRSLTERQAEAAESRGVSAETFRKTSERGLLRQFSEEIFRGELEWAASQFQSLSQLDQTNGLDTKPAMAAQ